MMFCLTPFVSAKQNPNRDELRDRCAELLKQSELQDGVIDLQKQRIAAYAEELKNAQEALAAGEGERAALQARIDAISEALDAEKTALAKSEGERAAIREELDKTRVKLDKAVASGTKKMIFGFFVGAVIATAIALGYNGN